MVARPPLRVRIEPMRLDDLDVVHAIERASFSAPWPPNAYRSELESNRLAHYLVARADDEIVGYGGMWLMVDEAHITTFAIHPAWRRQRIGERLLLAFLDLAVDRAGARGDARGAALEPAGAPALREVRVPTGRPPPALLQRRPRGRADHDHRAADRARRCASGSPVCGRSSTPSPAPGRPAIDEREARRRERPAPPRDRVVLRRDGDRPHRGRDDDPRERRRVAGRAPRGLGRDRARGRRARAPALDRPGARRGASTAGVALVGHRRRRGHLRARARGLAARRDQLRQGARLGPRACRSSASTTSRATSTPPGSRTPRRTAQPEPVFPLVALVVSGGHTFLAEMRDHLDVSPARDDRRRRRRRGVRQGRPAPRARLSGWPGDLARRRGRDRARPCLPAGLARRVVRLQLLGPQDRGASDRGRGTGR